MQDLEEIFGADGPLARAVPGFRPRGAQLQMAEARGPRPCAERRWLVAEAGTGTGKTFAYLVPALLSGRRVIVSTGTRTLQDQLFHRDLPLLGAALGRAVTVALLKGRSQLPVPASATSACPRNCRWSAAQATLAARIARWAQSTDEGDLAELTELPDGHPLRERITSTRDSCTGNRCAEFARCHVFAARRRANEADLVVVNHHLLLADLALKEEGFGDILPSADAVILDEAHQLPELAAQFFGSQFSVAQGRAAAGRPAARCWCRAASQRTHLAAVEAALRQALAARAGARAQSAAGSGSRMAWDDDLAAVDTAARALVDGAVRIWPMRCVALDGGDASLQQCAARHGAGRRAGCRAATRRRARARACWRQRQRGFTCQLVPFNVGATLRRILAVAADGLGVHLGDAGGGRGFLAFHRAAWAWRTAAKRCASTVRSTIRSRRCCMLPQGMPDPASPEYARCRGAMRGRPGGACRRRRLPAVHQPSRAGSTRHAQSARALGDRPGGPFRAAGAGRIAARTAAARISRAWRCGAAGHRQFLGGRGRAGPVRCAWWSSTGCRSLHRTIRSLRARLQHAREQGGNPFSDFQLPEAAMALKQGVGRLIRSEDDPGRGGDLRSAAAGQGLWTQAAGAACRRCVARAPGWMCSEMFRSDAWPDAAHWKRRA